MRVEEAGESKEREGQRSESWGKAKLDVAMKTMMPDEAKTEINKKI